MKPSLWVNKTLTEFEKETNKLTENGAKVRKQANIYERRRK